MEGRTREDFSNFCLECKALHMYACSTCFTSTIMVEDETCIWGCVFYAFTKYLRVSFAIHPLQLGIMLGKNQINS